MCGVLVFTGWEIMLPGGQRCRRKADAQVWAAGSVTTMIAMCKCVGYDVIQKTRLWLY